MIKHLMILLISASCIACQKSDLTQTKSIIGEFQSVDNSIDYSQLELREDKTFQFEQTKVNSCNIVNKFYGTWMMDKKRLLLFEGINLDTKLNVTTNGNLYLDTLTISFSDEFVKEFPNMKVRIGLDNFDTKIIDNQINFDKHAYCTNNKIFSDSEKDKRSAYDFYPLELNLRANNYYYINQQILKYDKIHFGLGSSKKIEVKKKKLIEYKVNKDQLYLINSSFLISHHELRRRKINKE